MDMSPELIEEAENLVLRTRYLVANHSIGVHRSRRMGGGVEFAEHREYSPGDDLRRLDWKASARTGRTLVKRFESERRTDVQLLVDRSGSMSFGTTTPSSPEVKESELDSAESKWDAACLLALTLAWGFLRQGDGVGISLWGEGSSWRRPVRNGRNWMHELAGELLRHSPAGPGSLGDAVHEVVARTPRSLVVVVSDCLDPDEERWSGLLAQHVVRGGEVWLLHLVDPAELDFPFQEPARFVDLEGGGSLPINPRELARQYRLEFQAFLERRREESVSAGIRYLLLNTGEGMGLPLRSFLEA